MPDSRYKIDNRIKAGEQLSTSNAIRLIRDALKRGQISPTRQLILTGDDRLDALAGVIYNDARYWWVLAVGSGIGWGLQVPAGTLIKVINLQDVLRILG